MTDSNIPLGSEIARSKNEETRNGGDVVFSDFVGYSPLLTWLLLVAPITTLSCVLLVWLDDEQPPKEKLLSIRILVGTTLGILFLYLFILPIRVCVKANGDIRVRVISLITYTFTGTVRAVISPGIWDDAYRARIKFVTNQDKRVVILRRKGKWDLCVSPNHPQEFVDAVSSVMTELEAQGGVS